MGYKLYIEKGVKVHTYEFSPKISRFSFSIGQDMKLETIDKLPKPNDDEQILSVINWSFFDGGTGKNGYGEIEIDGKQIKKSCDQFPSFSFKDGKLVYGDLPNAQVGAGIGVTLVINGKKNIINKGNVSTGKDTRTSIGQLKSGNIIFVVNEGDDMKGKGLSSSELADFFLKLGASNAFQGDSGGSSSMWADGRFVYKNVYRPVAGALVVYGKKSTQPKKDMRRTTSDLNIRNKGSILGKKIGLYKTYTTVEVLEEKSGWCRTKEGYISSKYLVKV